MRRWIEISDRYPKWIVGLGLLFAFGGVWISSGLKIRGDFAALLPSNFPSVKGFEEVTKKIGGQGFFILAVEGRDPEAVEKMSLALHPRLSELKTYLRSVQVYGLDPFLQKRALFLLEPSDLKEINKRLLDLRGQIRKTFRKTGPFSLDLDDPPASAPTSAKKEKEGRPTVSFDDLLRKYNLSAQALQGRGLITSPDRKIAVLLLQPLSVESDIPFIRRMVAAVVAVVQDLKKQPAFQALHVGYTGRYMVRLQEEDSINAQIATASTISLIGVLLLILLYTRRKRSVLLIGLPLLCGIAWTAGIVAYLVSHEINVMTAFIIALLFGLGIDLGIHFFMHYLQDREEEKDVQDALFAAMSSTGHAGSIAVFTSAGAFFVIMLTDLKGFQQFGMATGAGLLITLASFLLLMPALAILVERSYPLLPPRPVDRPPLPKTGFAAQTREAAQEAFAKASGLIHAKASLALDRATSAPLPSRLPWIGVIGGFFVMIAGSVILFSGQIKFNTNINSMITQSSSVLTYNRLKKEVFGGETEPGLLLFPSWEALRIFQRRLSAELTEGKWKTLRYAYSVASFAPSNLQDKVPLLAQIGQTLESKVWRLIEDDEDYKEENRALSALRKMSKQKPYTEAELPPPLRMALGGGLPLVYVVPKIDPTIVNQAIQYAKEIRTINAELAGNSIVIGDSNVILADMFVLLKRDGLLSVLLAFGAILLVLFVGFWRDLSSVPFVLFPLAVGMTAILVGMWLFDLPLHPFNVMALPVSLGLGIDHNVYILTRWRERGEGSIRESVRSISPAIGLAALTSIIGFGALIPLNHPGLRGLGVLATLGIACGVLAAFLLMPCILAVARDRLQGRPEKPTPPTSKAPSLPERKDTSLPSSSSPPSPPSATSSLALSRTSHERLPE